MEQERIREDILFVKEQLRQAVGEKSEQGRSVMVQIADMDYVRVLARKDTELEIVELLVRIYKYECKEGVIKTILESADTFEGLMNVYYKVLFGLQRIWFELEEEYQMEFVAYLQEYEITPYAVYMILNDSRIDEKEQVWSRVSYLWENYHE